MEDSRTPNADPAIARERLAALYPLAFALASASSFRTGLALRLSERVRLVSLANPASRPDPVAENGSVIPDTPASR
jgi:hypothetical protein